MAKDKVGNNSTKNRKIRPAATPEARENRCISLAYDLVERRLLEGTATSQETVHFLKLGTAKAKEELEQVKKQNKVLDAKVEAYESQKRVEELYAQAIDAFSIYRGERHDDE